MKTKTTKHGVHDEKLVGFSGYITPELKAIAQVTANERHTTMMDLVREGIIYHARNLGIVEADGRVSKKYKPIISAYIDVYNTRKATRKVAKGE